MSMQTVPARNEIAIEHTWNAESVFPTAADWQAEFMRIAAQLPDLERFQGRLGDGPAVLADWFATVDQLRSDLGKLYVYASMAHEVDTTDQEASARSDRTIGLVARAQAAAAFAEPELLAIGPKTLQEWAQAEPRLAIYAHYFDQIERRREHVRSAEIEELLGMVRDPFATAAGTHGVLADADLHFQPAHDGDGAEHALAQGTISALLGHPEREVRRTAWESYADAHLAVKNTMASCLAAGVKQQVFMARARRYPPALEAALATNHIPGTGFHKPIETLRRHLPTQHRYWAVRRCEL